MSVIWNTSSFIINPAKTIDKSAEIQLIGADIKCSDETVARIKELGLQSIAFNKYEEKQNVFNKLEERMWEKAKFLKDRVFKKNQDFFDAINFLELFAMYSLQADLNRLDKEAIKKLKSTQESEVREHSSVSKLVRLLETLSKMNIKGSKEEKIVRKKSIKRAIDLADKILIQNLSKTEAISLAKHVHKAEKILKKFS